MTFRAEKVERLMAALLAASSDAVVVVDSSGRIRYASPAVQTLFGYSPDELVGEPVEVLIPPEVAALHARHRAGYASSGRARQMGSGLILDGVTRDGSRFPVDVSLTPVETDGEPYVAAIVRDATARVRTQRQIESVNDITSRFLGGSPLTEVLPVVAAQARSLTISDAAWIVMPTADGGAVVAAADGTAAAALLGLELSATSRSALVMQNAELDVVPDLSAATNVPPEVAALGLGPAMYLPMTARDRSVGALIVARSNGSAPFAEFDSLLARSFAGAAAMAIALGRARSDLERTRVSAEYERIAMDLHDRVIQRAFAVGMSLEAVRGLATGTVADRIDSAVEELDVVIRELRNSIFRLSRPASADRSLRQQVLTVCDRASERLGFPPRIEFLGEPEAVVGDEVADAVLAVTEEALSNVARHAHARQVRVVVTIGGHWLTLRVTDDGIGRAHARAAGNGLVNMQSRAKGLGGTCSVEDLDRGGVAVCWQVPLVPGAVPPGAVRPDPVAPTAAAGRSQPG
jgi:PAS domain S-box-containing protein